MTGGEKKVFLLSVPVYLFHERFPIIYISKASQTKPQWFPAHNILTKYFQTIVRTGDHPGGKRIYSFQESRFFTIIKGSLRACIWSRFGGVRLFATHWTAAHQAPLFMRFSRQDYWSWLPCPSLRDLPNPGIEPRPPARGVDILVIPPPGKSRHPHP